MAVGLAQLAEQRRRVRVNHEIDVVADVIIPVVGVEAERYLINVALTQVLSAGTGPVLGSGPITSHGYLCSDHSRTGPRFPQIMITAYKTRPKSLQTGPVSETIGS